MQQGSIGFTHLITVMVIMIPGTTDLTMIRGITIPGTMIPGMIRGITVHGDPGSRSAMDGAGDIRTAAGDIHTGDTEVTIHLTGEDTAMDGMTGIMAVTTIRTPMRTILIMAGEGELLTDPVNLPLDSQPMVHAPLIPRKI
jgi:hypothetical protein